MFTFSGFHVPDIDDASIGSREDLLLGAAECNSCDFGLYVIIGAICVDLP